MENILFCAHVWVECLASANPDRVKQDPEDENDDIKNPYGVDLYYKTGTINNFGVSSGVHIGIF